MRQTDVKLVDQLKPGARILALRLDTLGDCVLASSFFIGLRRLFPHAHLTAAFNWLTAPLFEACPLFDRLIAVPVGTGESWGALLEPPYDAMICPRWDVDPWATRRFALMAEAPIRIGFDRGPYRYDEPHDGWAGAYFTHLARTRSDLHEVLKGKALLEFLGDTEPAPDPRLWIARETAGWAEDFLHSKGIGRCVVLTVQAGWGRRVWPVANFLPVIDALLAAEPDLRFVVIGAEDAAASGRWLQQQRSGSVLNVTGTLPLMKTAALIARASLYVGMDTGPMHLAAAAGVPVVEISCHPMTGGADHPNSPSRFGPYATPSRVLRPARPLPPCTDGCNAVRQPHCITQVPASTVAEAALALLEQAST
ncbi:MAG: glycosyltransferase family 9 protein [Aliidongia sp.]